MDSNNNNTTHNQTPDTPESDHSQEQQQQPTPLPIASLSLSLSTILPSNFFHQPKTQTFHSPNKLKLPTQASSLTHLSLSTHTPSPSPSKSSFKSTISSNPLHNPPRLNPLLPNHPSNSATARRSSIVWFRNDLRLHDNESLTQANNDSLSLLPVYCLDPSDYGKSSSDFDKTGPYRANFLIQSVTDLRNNLQSRVSDLVVRVGKSETVLLRAF
ncbi:hypothetical protein RIF29_41092 [Crotalaria pallida]|uniref:Photolyase/cryptochrome alpha/beta domain-containing protein n=1 Tax=Crotalaria pallida TaxID=3830 RepID=A0AAN9EAM3_CROPI